MIFIFIFSFFSIHSIFCMEKISLKNDLNDFFKTHNDILQKTEGKSAFCNIIDYLSATLDSLENVQHVLQKTVTVTNNLSENSNKIFFTPSVELNGSKHELHLESLSAEVVKNSLLNKPKDPQSITGLWNNNAKKHLKIIIPNQDPKLIYNILAFEQKFATTTLPSMNEIISTNFIDTILGEYPKAALNCLLLVNLYILKEIKTYKFPYECDCANLHINHLDNVIFKSVCIKKISNLFDLSKQTFYNPKTLAMITDLIKQILFYKQLLPFKLLNYTSFLSKTILRFYFDIKRTEDYLASYNQIQNEIYKKSDLLFSLKECYKTFYRELASSGQDARRRSPVIFGPLQKLDQIKLSEPNKIFLNFITINQINELNKSATSEHGQVYEEFLTSYNEGKDKNTAFKKTIPKKNNISVKKDNHKKALAKKTIKTNQFESSKNAYNVPIVLSKKDLLKNEIKKYKLFYLSSYLKTCLASNDNYHTFPYIIDIMTILYGIPRKDLEAHNASTHFWTIAVTDADHKNTEYFAYKIVKPTRDNYIFHRGPLKLTNLNLLRQFQNNPTVFDTILKDASLAPHNNTILKNIINEDALKVSDNKEYCEIDENQSIINDNFKGLFGSEIIEVNEQYVVILALLSKKIIYFPLKI